MTVQLSALRVSAEMDASSYTAAAAKKVAADHAMTASGKSAGAAVGSLSDALGASSSKISQAGDVLSKLSRQYVEGYAATQRFNSALGQLSRGIDTGKISMASAEPILEGIYRKYGLMGDAAQFAAKGQVELAAAVSNANAKLAAQKAITPANLNRTSGGNFNASNAAYQVQDIFVQAGAGTSAGIVALQQGPQLGMAIQAAMGEAGAAGAVKTLGAAFLSIVSPVNIAAIAFTAAAALSIQYFAGLLSNSAESEESLRKQADLIKSVNDRWGAALPALKAFNDEQQRTKDIQDALAAGKSLSAKQYNDVRSAVVDLNVGISETVSLLRLSGAESSQVGKLQDAYNALRDKISDSTAKGEDARRVQEELTSLLRSSGILAIGDYASEFGTLAASIDDASAKAARFREEAALLKLQASLGPLNTLDAFNRTPFQTEEEIRAARSKAQRDDAEAILAGRGVPIPQWAPNREDAAAERERVARSASGGGSKADPYRDLIKSADDRLAQMRVEIELTGKTGAAAAALRYETELLNQATDKGRQASPAQRKEIAAKAEEYGRLTEKLTAARMAQDLLFERQQMFRSPIEQRVASELRGAGLDQSSEQGKLIAGQIRLNEQLALGRDLTMDFASGFVDDLRNGVSILDALGNGLSRLADQLIQMALNQAINGLFSNLLGAAGLGAFPSAPAGGGFESGIGLFAKGGAFAGGNVIPFARGGVVNRPTLFPFARGIGLMGEAGAEAIMPLARDSQGRLGVRGGAANQNGASGLSLTFAPSYNVTGTTEDIDRLRQQMAQDRREFESRTVAAVRSAQSKRQL